MLAAFSFALGCLMVSLPTMSGGETSFCFVFSEEVVTYYSFPSELNFI